MSNNRNQNRSRNRGGNQKSAPVQDRVFTFKSKTGAVIRIPASVEYDPDADLLADIADAVNEGNDLVATGLMVRVIKSGFPPEIAEQIRLKASEVKTFSERYFAFSGVDIPK